MKRLIGRLAWPLLVVWAWLVGGSDPGNKNGLPKE